MKNIFLTGIFLLLTCFSYAEDTKISERRWGIAPIAAPYYTPDTGLAIGAYIVTYLKPEDSSTFTTPDELSFYAAYTEKKQVSLGLIPNIFFGGGALKLSGKGELNKYPTAFWGTGPDTDDDAKEVYTPVEAWGDLSLLFRLRGGLYIGPLFHFRNSSIEDTEDNGIVESGVIPGSDGTREIGGGFSLQYDSRNSVFYPVRGFFIEGKSSLQREEFSSEYNFSRFEIDARWFAGITGDHVIALQVKAEGAAGDVPLQSLCGIGGNELMRGYLRDRYVDKTSTAAQAEYRFPIAWRFAGVFFASAGEVQKKPADYNTADIHYAGGAGLRFILDRSQHITARADCGINEDGTINIYFLAKEAF